MGKSQFKFAADQVVDDCIKKGLRDPKHTDYYWAYVNLFTEFNYSFDLDKFNEYILKRM
jgi:hypothetical protein